MARNSKVVLFGFCFFWLLCLKSSLHGQDWANLAKYQKENSMLSAQENTRVVFMGNSITEGWIAANPNFFQKKPYANRGIGGQTTPQMLLRFQQDVIALQPKVVVILAGTNDIAGNTGPITLEQIRDNILSMVQLAKANNIIPVVCAVLPALDYPWSPGRAPDKNIPKLNTLLKEITLDNAIPYLDYFTAMVDTQNGLKADYTTDGVHVTPAGYAVMEQLLSALLKTLLPNG